MQKILKFVIEQYGKLHLSMLSELCRIKVIKGQTLPPSIKKKRIAIEEKKYRDWKGLYNAMLNEVMSVGENIHFAQDYSPEDIVNQWREYLGYMLYNIQEKPLNMSLTGTHTMRSITGKINKISAKRKKMINKGKLSKFEIAWMPPQVIAMRSDRFGSISKLISKALRLTDDAQQSYEQYANGIIDSRGKFRSFFDELMSGITDRESGRISKVDLNNGLVYGLDKVHVKSKIGLTTVPGERISIVGQQEDSYIARILDQDGNMTDNDILIHKDEIYESDTTIKRMFVEQYLDTLLNELSDGQVRHIIPKTMPPPDVDKASGRQSYKKGSDGEYISKRIREMGRDRKNNIENDGNRSTPGIYSTTYRGEEYFWMMVKQGETKPSGEVYHAYLIKKQKVDKQDRVSEHWYFNQDLTRPSAKLKELEKKGVQIGIISSSYKQEEIDAVLPGGFYKSDSTYDYGEIIHWQTGEVIENSSQQEYINFRHMSRQPNADVFNARIGGFSNMWDYLYNMRVMYRNMSDNIMRQVESEDQKRTILELRIDKKLKSLKLSPDQITDVRQSIFEQADLTSRVWVHETEGFLDDDGNFIEGKKIIRTPNSFFSPKSENFSPHFYDDTSVHIMADGAISRIDREIADLEATETRTDEEYNKKIDRLEALREAKKHFFSVQQMAANMIDGYGDEISKIVESERSVHTKHIASWTNRIHRRKDGDIHNEYVRKVFGMLQRNELVGDLLDNVYRVLLYENQFPSGSIEYMSNRVRMAVGDSRSRRTGLFWGDGSYEKIAMLLNKIPEGLKQGREWTPDAAERLIKHISAIPSMMFLNAGVSMGNRTQIVNNIIIDGFGYWQDAQNELETRPEFWQEVIDNTGVLNLMSMFQEIMLQDGNVDKFDFGFLPMTGIPRIGKWWNLAKLKKRGRPGFINKTEKFNQIDKFLTKLEARSRGRDVNDIQVLKEVWGDRKSFLKKKRAAFYDLLIEDPETAFDESQREKILTARIQKLVGNINDSKIKRMVTWMVAYFPIKSGKELLTFQGSENRLRSVSLVMSLLKARDRGEISGTDEKSMYMSDAAVRIGRNAVYQTQFGMTPVYAGEGFNGVGRALWQWKQYPMQQTMFDMKILKKLDDGSTSKADTVSRLVLATAQAVKRMGTKNRRYDPNDPYLDHEALSAVRWLWTRAFASALTSGISIAQIYAAMGSVPPLAKVSPAFMSSMRIFRNFSSPAFGIPIKMMVLAAYYAMDGDEEQIEKEMERFGWSFAFLLLPMYLTMIVKGAYDIAQWADEID